MISFMLLAAAVALYIYSTRTFTYWQERGIKHDKPIPFFGTNISNYLLLKSITQVLVDVYFKYPNEKVVGFFRSSRPVLVIRDPEIVKRILITDFYNFYPRGLNTHNEPLLRNVVSADGDVWRLLRRRMTPAFTSDKLRAMFPLITERAERLQARVLVAAPHTIDARNLMARYTTDCIGSCGFGLEADSLINENSPFRELGAKIIKIRLQDAIVAVLKSTFPEIFRRLKHTAKVEADVFNLVGRMMELRNYEPSGRNDFIDLLLQCRKKGLMIGESIENVKSSGIPEEATLEMTDEIMSAQVFMFFSAGFETSSSITSFALHQLAFHPRAQRLAQEEVDRVLTKHGRMSFDAIKEMKYLEWTLKEGMRMFPVTGFLLRQCARKCTIPEIGVELDPGVGVMIPLQALHNDPKYFPNPEEFRPERFHPDQVDVRNNYVYLPFGEGPRACIGARLGLMQSVAGLAAILATCSVSPAPESLRYPRVDPKADIVQNILGGLPLIFHRRESKLMQ